MLSLSLWPQSYFVLPPGNSAFSSLTMLAAGSWERNVFLNIRCCHFMQSTVFDSQSSSCLIQSHCLALIWQTDGHSDSTVRVLCITEPTKCCFYKKVTGQWCEWVSSTKDTLTGIWCLLAVHSKKTLWEWEQTVSACLPGAQGVPGRINISIKVLLRGLASANTVARVIIGKDVAVDACA